MVAKRGRPAIEDSKSYMLRVRMNEKALNQLDECCEYENKSRSEIVRECIEDKHSRLKK